MWSENFHKNIVRYYEILNHASYCHLIHNPSEEEGFKLPTIFTHLRCKKATKVKFIDTEKEK